VASISVVIPTRGRPDLIGRSVRAVLANRGVEFDLTVIDQSDDDRTAKVVNAIAAHDPRVRYVHTMPPGLSRAYNLGVTLTSAPIIAFTDDDCVAAPDWVLAIAAAFASQPDANMLYGRVALPSELTNSIGHVPVLPIPRAERLDARNGFRIYGMGANFAVRRALMERIGGFDEILGGGGPLRSSQDFDLQYRAYRGGAVVLLRPEISVDHYGLRDALEWPKTLRAYGIGDGAFYMKHIRCGDVSAAMMFGRRVVHTMLRQIRHVVDRRRPSHATYLRALFAGVRASIVYRVDRQRRLYLPRQEAGQARRSVA
jgi:glycosyltransferase involved in cell wall biosynthesis